MNVFKLKFQISTNDATCPFGLDIWINNTHILTHKDCLHKLSFGSFIFEHDCDDHDEYELKLVLHGKTSDHTKIANDGNIVKDVTLNISNISIDDLDVNQLFLKKCVYTHDFNGTQPEIVDTFHGIAGCNGTISFKFSTPIYLWLLENM